ncbi:hypothetical protein [Streptomyces cupreus]|uniref:IrrE N-terminal-like domain-containing protein n=1 Tax=Streptomyces cupreus TaxID=2759956 RepID=A0A7X1J551_9ACTN|nr:hypothetical protein [Streptomyces cupreus]MBC2904368.1 hypothetical protein [Streptomyces cupreus]
MDVLLPAPGDGPGVRGPRFALREATALWSRRRRVVRAAKKLGLRPDLGLQAVVARVADLRGQPIDIVAEPLPRATTGLCCFGEHRDTIVVNAAAEPLHRVLITLHELWHLIEDFVGPRRPVRIWRRCVLTPLERCGLREPRPAQALFGEHSVFELDNLPDVLNALSPELVRAVLDDRRQVKMRGEHNHGHDPAEVFARQMLQMLALDEDTDGTGPITSSFAHRRTGI